jgi:uncharacterized membrane protein
LNEKTYGRLIINFVNSTHAIFPVKAATTLKHKYFYMETQSQTSAGTTISASALPPATGSSNINLSASERIVSAFGGAALTVLGLKHLRSSGGIGILLSGSYLLVRGLSGYCAISNMLGRNTGTGTRTASAMEISSTFTINKPRMDIYSFWRKLENLPKFMQHLEKVKELDDKRSTWTAKIPGGIGTVSWEAEITEDISGEVISWCSLPGSTVDNAGEVRFKDTSTNGTEVEVKISYRLPAGDLGSIAAKLFNPAIERMMRDDIRSFKQLLETGDTAVGGDYGSQNTSNSNAESREALSYSVSGS